MSPPKPNEEMVRVFKTRNTTSHLFKIDNFSFFKKHGTNRIDSSVFDLAGHNWQLSVFPDGYYVEGHVSIYLFDLYRTEGHVPIYLFHQCELFLVNQLEENWHSHGKFVYSTNTCMGHQKFISLADFNRNGYLIGDCCMFGVKIHGIEPAKPGTAEYISLIEKPLNNKVTWMITKFSTFNPRKVHQSDEFVVGNRKWRIKVHPRGCKGEEDKSFSVYLSAEGFINNAPKGKTYQKFKLRVLDQVSWNHVEKTVSDWIAAKPDDDNYGFANLMPLGNLREPYLVNDKLYVGVEFEVISITNYC